MITDCPRVSGADVELTVHLDGARQQVRWSLPPESEPDDEGAADAALTATLLVAMARQESLHLTAPVSRRLLQQTGTIQDVFDTWARHSELIRGLPPVFRRVEVDVKARRPALRAAAMPDGRRAACFFSGGLDSLASAIAHRDEGVTLVYVHGLDVPLHRCARRARLSKVVRHTAETLGLSLIEVETDVRSFTDHDVDWLDGHGAALAGVALLLGQRFSRVYVPATETYATLMTLGSHPLVDPLWSTERVEVVHDAATNTRVDKLRVIDAVPVARETLRVCVRDDVDDFNCGRCWKCILTMVGVYALGIAERFPTLPDLDEGEFLRRVAQPDPGQRVQTWDRHRTIWAPYLAAARANLGSRERRRLEAALALRYRARAGPRRPSTRAGRDRRARPSASHRSHGIVRVTGAHDDLSFDVVDDLPGGLLDAVARRPTPFYVFDLSRVERRARAFRAGMESVFPHVSFAYPYKVNPMTAVARRAVSVYGAAEIATPEELSLAVSTGSRGRDCFLGGIGKSTGSLCAAAADGATLKIDSVTELQRLRNVWPELAAHEGWRVLLRIALPEGDGWSRFGLLPEEACDAVASNEPWTRRLGGVHFHCGTSLQDPRPYQDAARHCMRVLDAVAAARATERPVLDIGGGYPNCPDAEVEATAACYGNAVAATLEEAGWSRDRVEVVCEPGRVTVERAGYLVATVVEPTRGTGGDAVVVDAGSTLAGGSWAPVRAGRTVVFVGGDVAIAGATCDVYGNLCHEGDLVAEAGAVVRDERYGAIAVIGDVGGYRLAAAAPWMQQLPAVYELRDGDLVTLRRALPLARMAEGSNASSSVEQRSPNRESKLRPNLS